MLSPQQRSSYLQPQHRCLGLYVSCWAESVMFNARAEFGGVMYGTVHG